MAEPKACDKREAQRANVEKVGDIPRCIKTYQIDPFISDIEITAYDYIRNYDVDGLCKYHAKKDKKEKIEKNEPIDIYIGQYWYNGKCIKTYQKDPVVTDIEITVSDYVNNYDSMVNNGERYQDYAHELLQELTAADAVLTHVNDKRKKNTKSNVFIAGSNFIAGMEKADPDSFSKEEDLEPEEIWARGEGTWQQLWFSRIRVLSHAGE